MVVDPTVALASRERDPGTRHDVYRVNNDVWYHASASRDRILTQFISLLTEGIDAVGPETPAGERLSETKSFFSFLLAELPQIVERWRAMRAADHTA